VGLQKHLGLVVYYSGPRYSSEGFLETVVNRCLAGEKECQLFLSNPDFCSIVFPAVCSVVCAILCLLRSYGWTVRMRCGGNIFDGDGWDSGERLLYSACRHDTNSFYFAPPKIHPVSMLLPPVERIVKPKWPGS
jgi:hypothetical protein